MRLREKETKQRKKKKAKIVNQPTGKFWKEREINNIDTEKTIEKEEKKIQQNKLLMMMKMVEEMIL
jgi:hypothetical protein